MSEASQPDATTTASNRKAETDRERSRDDPAVESAAAPSVSEGGTESAVVVSGGGDGRSFQQLLAGAIAAPAVSPRTAPIIAAVPVVAVPCFIAPAGLIESSGFTGHFAMTHQAVLATVTARAQMQLQGAYPSSSSELATSSLAQPMLTAIGPVPLQQKPVGALEENVCTPEVDQPPSSELKSQSPRVIIKAASSDGYNWRKYGQKQVKSSDRSRSYYKCTNADCSAKKKVEHRQDGHVTEIIYRGIHNHDPPLKQRYSKEKGSQSGGPSEENENIEVPSEELNEADQTTSKTEQITAKETPEQQLHCSSDCEEDAAVRNEDDVVDEPEPKRRLTECNVPCTTPILRTVKEPKIVVQTASDAGIVSDGYRWRKYGQKIVKGNPNPRSYYRCTHNGCPVRKHVERALEDAKAMVITYEGKHNHDLPTPKNCNDPSAAALIISAAAAATATTTEQLQSPDSSTDQMPSAKSLEDTDGGNTGEKLVALEGKNTMESAQTLLSIGSNSSPAGEMSNGTNSSSIQRPIFSDNHAVQVQNS